MLYTFERTIGHLRSSAEFARTTTRAGLSGYRGVLSGGGLRCIPPYGA